MQVTKQNVEFLIWKYDDSKDVLKAIEQIGRVCYKSEERITEDSAERFVQNLLKRGHESVLEHIVVTARFITDRAIANELVRHRIAAYSQESTRYCRYAEDVQFVLPEDAPAAMIGTVVEACEEAEHVYKVLLEMGATPEFARDVLPLCTKTELIATYNLREWRHILTLRTDKAAHPKMRKLMNLTLRKFKDLIPVVFDDIEGSEEE